MPVTIKSSSDISGIFQMNLICQGHQINFYKNGVKLLAGEEKSMEASLILTKEMIGELKGDCKIKSSLKGEYVLLFQGEILDQWAVLVFVGHLLAKVTRGKGIDRLHR